MAYAEKRGSGKFPWRVRYKLPDGTLGSEPGFRTKRQAEDWGDDQEAAIRHGRWQDPQKARTHFGEWQATWMAAQKVAPATVAKRRHLLKRHLLPHWEHTPICEINLFTAKAWANQQTCAQATVNQSLTLLSMILTGAADAGYLLANPMYGRKRQSERASHDTEQHQSDEVVWAQPGEAVRIYERLGGVAGLMVLVTAFTGLRWGELAGLHRDNCLLLREDRLDGVPLPRRVLRVDPRVGSLHEVEFELSEEELAQWRVAERERLEKAAAAGREARLREEPVATVRLYLGPPKNKTSAREVDLPPFLAVLLEEHLEEWPHDYVFSTPKGTFWRRGNYATRNLRPAADGRPVLVRKQGTAGRPGWEPILPGLTMRWLRHTHDTWMKEDKVDRALRFATMGWAVGDIEGVYEHVTPLMRRERLDALEVRWARARAGGLPESG